MLRYLPFVGALFFVTACTEPTSEVPPATPAGLTSDATAAPDTSVAGVTRLDLGTLGGTSSSASDIDVHGVIIGSSRVLSEKVHGFRWTAEEGMVDLPPLPGDDESGASQILPDGRVFGSSSFSGRVTAVTWSPDGVPTPVELPPRPDGLSEFVPVAINEQGAMTGTAIINHFKQSAWYWSPTVGFVDITGTTPGKSNEGSARGMSQSGYVIGLDRPRGLCDFTPGEFSGLCLRTYLWREDSGYIFIGSPDHHVDTEVRPGGVNNSGVVTGSVDYSGRGQDPFRWSREGGWVLLSTPEGEGSGLAINDKGTVVGEVHRPGGNARATVWTRNGVRIELAPSDSLASFALAVNDRDVVVGSAAANGVFHATRWTIEKP